MFLGLYFKWKSLEKKLFTLGQLMNFFWFLMRSGIFGKGDPKLSLVVLSKYLSLEAFSYPSHISNYRSIETSVDLFETLVNMYIETKSEVRLDQILGIYKEEFIKRSLKKDGRK